MKFLYIPLIILSGLIALYFKFCYERIMEYFKIGKKEESVRIFSWIAFVCVFVCLMNIKRTASLYILHVFFIDLGLRLVLYIIRKISPQIKEKKVFLFLKSSLLPLILSLVVMVMGYFNMNNVRCTYYEINTEKNLKENYRIAMISDVHYKTTLDKEDFEKKCEEISGKGPDIVVLCGDITDDGTGNDGIKEVYEMLGRIKNKYGIYFVYGNHDRMFGSKDGQNKFLEKEITKNGIKILNDKSEIINGDICLLGREDDRFGTNKRKTVSELLKIVEKETYSVILDHRPYEYEKSADKGADLILSGHTHGGQIWPINHIQEVFKMNDAVYGKGKIKNTDYIVSSGFAGWGYPIKTCAKSEYVIIDIRKK